MVHEMLMKLGIPTYTDTYFTLLDGTTPVKIGQNMPIPIGWIYGISTNVDTVLPTDQSKSTIALADPSQIYLYFKIGTTLFINNLRLDTLLYYGYNAVNKDGYYTNQMRYFPVNIPNVTDLKESYYNNPTGIADVYIPLTIHYIDKPSYDMLVKKGYFFDGVAGMPLHPSHKDHPKNKMLK